MVSETSGQEQVAGETSRMAGAGPAGHIPPQLVPGAALSARANEVVALLRMMSAARANQTTRAWQQLPRELRRRAASHNLLRLPRRLRAKALREMQASKTEPRPRSLLRTRLANYPHTAADRRRERLRDRAARPMARWLETHRWHAKRFRMTRGADDKLPAHHRLKPNRAPAAELLPMGLVVAQTPHQKAQRTTWRAASDAVVLHDASYSAWFRLDAFGDQQGAAETLSAALRAAGIASGPDAAQGARTELLLSGSFARETVLLSSPPASTDQDQKGPLARVVAPILLLRFFHAKGASAILRTHPSLVEHVRHVLDLAISSSNTGAKVILTPLDLAPHPSLAVPHERSSPHRVRDADKPLPSTARKKDDDQAAQRQARREQVRSALKFWSGMGPNAPRKRQRGHAGRAFAGRLAGPEAGWNTFSLTGPGAGRLVGAVLRPAPRTSPTALRALTLIAQNLVPAQVPRGFVLPLRVQDPRLSFPPQLPPNGPLAARNATKRAKDEFGRPQAHPRPRARKRKRQTVVLEDAGGSGLPSSVQRFHQLFDDVDAPPSSACSSPVLADFFHSPPGVPHFTQGDIDVRRARAAGGLVPGATVPVGKRDETVPVVLIRTDVRTGGVAPLFSASGLDASASAEAGAKAREGDAAAGWTLLVPRGWGMAFWRSLVHPHTRVAALDAQAHLALEARSPTFPDDYLAPLPGRAEGVEKKKKEEEEEAHPFALVWRTRALIARREWHRRPSGKRTAVPPDADAGVGPEGVERAQGLELFPHHAEGWQLAARMARARALAELPLTPLAGLATALADTTPWLLGVASAERARWVGLAYALFSPQVEPTAASTRLGKALQSVAPASWGPELERGGVVARLASAFVLVHIECVRKGALAAPAAVVMVREEEDHRWRSALAQLAVDGRDEGAKTAVQELELGLGGPAGAGRAGLGADARIGTLTSAGFSLTHGRAHGVGAVSVLALCQLYLRDERYAAPGAGARRGRNAVRTARLVAVQNGAGQPRRAGTLDPLVL